METTTPSNSRWWFQFSPLKNGGEDDESMLKSTFFNLVETSYPTVLLQGYIERARKGALGGHRLRTRLGVSYDLGDEPPKQPKS